MTKYQFLIIDGPIQCVVSYRDQCAHKHTETTIVNRNKDMVRKAGKLQSLFARMLTDHISQVTWYAKVHNFQGVTF